jgi:major type 1 subunit fimbrin (pilin)
MPSKILIALLCLAAAPAYADDPGPGGHAELLFSGEIVKSTCAFDMKSTRIELARIGSNAFDAVGATAGRTGFQITVGHCGIKPQEMFLAFDAGADIDAASGRIRMMGADNRYDGLELQLLNEKQEPIDLTSGVRNERAVSGPDGSARLRYYVEYYAGRGDVGTGKHSATVPVTLAYD